MRKMQGGDIDDDDLELSEQEDESAEDEGEDRFFSDD